MNLGVMVSHRGSGLQAIIDACEQRVLDARIAVAICNNSGALALKRAKNVGIPAVHLSSKTHPDSHALDAAILQTLTHHQVDMVVTVGYLKKLSGQTLKHYQRRIINIHPSLLPAYGGRGMYGQNIHAAVIKNQEKESGITIHYVDGEYDTGDIIAQMRIPVTADDTAASLEQKILRQEHPFLIATLSQLIKANQGVA